MTKNECVDAICDELRAYDIKPEIIHRTKHIEVSWNYKNKRRSFTTSSTTGDVRAKLNARASVRRLLKQDGATKPVKSLLEKALSLPTQGPTGTLVERITKLENDFAGLLDMFKELQNPAVKMFFQLGDQKYFLKPKQDAIPITESTPLPIPALTPPQQDMKPTPIVKISKKTGKPSRERYDDPKQNPVYKLLSPSRYTPLDEILKKMHPRPKHHVQSRLHFLREKGLAKCLRGTGWKRIDNHSQA